MQPILRSRTDEKQNIRVTWWSLPLEAPHQKIRHKAPENFFWPCPSTFLARKVQLVVLVSAFVVVSTVWSSFFFAVL